MISIQQYFDEEERIIFENLVKGKNIIFNEKNRYEVRDKGIRSNLSVKQYVTTKTQNFIYWSNDQHLTDLLGQPLVVRHGSFIAFKQFGDNENGIYFADFEHAIQYAKSRLDQEVGGISYGEYGVNMYECFIKAHKRFICNREKYRDIKVNEIRDQGYDGIVAYNTRDSQGSYHQYIVKQSSQIYTIQKH